MVFLTRSFLSRRRKSSIPDCSSFEVESSRRRCESPGHSLEAHFLDVAVRQEERLLADEEEGLVEEEDVTLVRAKVGLDRRVASVALESARRGNLLAAEHFEDGRDDLVRRCLVALIELAVVLFFQ